MDFKFSKSSDGDSHLLEIVDGEQYYLLEIFNDQDVVLLKRLDDTFVAIDTTIKKLFDIDGKEDG